MPRITGKKGVLYIPLADGLSISNAALTKSATKEIGGVSYANRFYGTSSRSSWQKSKDPTVRLQGIVGEATITPGTANNTVDVSAFSYYDDNGAVNTSTAATLTLTRNADGAQWHMIHVTNSSGTASVTVGVVSASTTAFVETWAATAGPAYVATTETLIGAVKLTPGGAGLVSAGDIVYSFPTAGTLLQERSDIPTFSILPMEGGVLLNAALLGCHTAGAARTLYASYYDQYPLMAKLGDIDGWTLGGSSDTTSMEACEDYAAQTDLSGAAKWNGTLSRFYISDETVFAMAMQKRTAILRLYPDGDITTKYYEGAVIIKSWGISVSVGSAVKESVSFDGDGNLELRGF
jgi:hypothetical protein